MFPGFFRPKSNFYRLPNDWFDIWIDIRQTNDRTRILAPLKVTEYTIKWTWGYQNYDEPVRISRRDFQYGKRAGCKRLDRGTNLSSRGLEKALDFLREQGVIEEKQEEEHRPLFLPRLRPTDQDPPGFLGGDTVSHGTPYVGFERPEANYFKVPAIWTDLTHDANSESLILATEYFFRHTWGWHGNGDKAHWLDTDDVANGRRYRSDERQGERYDQGIGYSERSVRNALNEGVKRGWLVWREEEQKKEYALHLEGMRVSKEGEYLGTVEKTPIPEPPPPSSLSDPALEERTSAAGAALKDIGDANVQAEIVQLHTQVAALTETVNGLLHLLCAAGLDVRAVLDGDSIAGTEVSTAPTEVSTAPSEASTAPDGSKYSAYYTDTASNTASKTPPPDTPARATTTNSDDDENDDDQNVGGGVISPSLESLIDRLTSLETPMSPDAASDLISTYGEQPVHAWLDVLEHDPTVRSVPALLIHKLRAGETPPLKPPRKQRHGSNRGYSSQRGRVVTLEEMPQVEMEEPLPLP
ncbi:MAG: hypothetical protein SXV54_07725 [Chloroflexota bacterium]|nr:hypothetical protein [Chloroflexota bacterium]